MIKIDGNKFSGGGQIVRTAIALATITGKAIKIKNIRKGRKVPGLKAQHLTLIKTLTKILDIKTEGAHLRSETIIYTPKKTTKIIKNNLKIDIGTAGSITLLLQGILIPAIFLGIKKIEIIGGTDVKWSPSIDYFREVFLPTIKEYADIEIKIKQRGYYPKGKGKVEIIIKSKIEKITEKIDPINITKKGKLIQIKGIIHATKDLINKKINEKQAEIIKNVLKKEGVIHIKKEYVNAESKGNGVTLWAIYANDEFLEEKTFIGTDKILSEGKTPKHNYILQAKKIAEKLIKEINSKGTIDQHLTDHMIPFIGLFEGKIKTSKITEHTKSNIYVTEKILGIKIKIDKNKNIISYET